MKNVSSWKGVHVCCFFVFCFLSFLPFAHFPSILVCFWYLFVCPLIGLMTNPFENPVCSEVSPFLFVLVPSSSPISRLLRSSLLLFSCSFFNLLQFGIYFEQTQTYLRDYRTTLGHVQFDPSFLFIMLIFLSILYPCVFFILMCSRMVPHIRFSLQFKLLLSILVPFFCSCCDDFHIIIPS